MTNEVRKPPREFWVIQERGSNRCLIREPGEKWSCDVNGEPHSGWIHCKEILPGDDSIRVSQVLTADLQMILSHVNPLNMSLADETTYWQLKNRIERESKV